MRDAPPGQFPVLGLLLPRFGGADVDKIGLRASERNASGELAIVGEIRR
jgi:hypothetical protein